MSKVYIDKNVIASTMLENFDSVNRRILRFGVLFLSLLNELSPAARLLISVGVSFASVMVGILVSLWVANFDGRVCALETQADVARTERADFAEESRQRDEESCQRDHEIPAALREG